MINKKSLVKLLYWSKFSAKKRSKLVSARVKKGWAKKTPEERKKWSQEMLMKKKQKKLSPPTP